ncbi:MAG: 4Fe-4S binding protein [Candidatus Bathyarchaeales archaeon]
MMSKEKGWKEIPMAAVCWKPSTEFLTGDWKTYKPVLDPEKCTRCLLCAIFCPEGAINWKTKKEDIEFDYNFCKGCGICANECPTKAIEMKLE